ncbi:26S proteasome non-ATPase regulatory subunit [Serendipita sp. 396]|nr:26S proteasome non-ATPase regulatory subunit [Serendipita sp. 396]KAG8785406.1 26S proteasome non-ATPase regulatory subunit [Serendipita sp. 397]KAG8828256.1 26S proteasome non-ATPase regulatory subunit [Serendipita sp. 401]KAG8836159.1 26S proteasome non-ATPase regulatory subunit [Serendipita sp. 400]KAG8858200.1 26S proteasome non-ATPase regulatory subunit [Serendipita sp. 411]KAG8868679.1 26S proteasome non-ATPase regulatory subunit [Serendipita sp. 405]KAG9058749.1 26S proteasome non-A
MAAKDTEMKNLTLDTDVAAKDKEKNAPVDEGAKKLTPVQEIKANVALIQRGVSSMEPRFAHRVLRGLTGLRKVLNSQVIAQAIEENLVKDGPAARTLKNYLKDSGSSSMDIDATTTTTGPLPTQDIPETEMYLRLLLIHHLLSTPTNESRQTAFQLARDSVQKIQSLNRRTMDPIGAKVWSVYGRACEVIESVQLAALRPELLAAQRTAALRRDDDTQAVLINLLLRNYIHYKLFSQADKFVSKTNFPQSAGNPQLARHHFYLGRIKAVQLSYTQAHTQFEQAIRRAPPATTAPGFYQAVHKFFIVVELLMGEIPERQMFRHVVLEKPLKPYAEIVRAVRTGSLSQFQAALQTHSAQFTADNTLTLLSRLRQNVIKTGLRKLSLAYSRISLRDICLKLHLESEEDAEYVVGKAIRDGVIEASIIHERGWMVQKGYEIEGINTLVGVPGAPGSGAKQGAVGKATLNLGGKPRQPGEALVRSEVQDGLVRGYGPEVVDVFGRRISFCLQLHNESVRAMRYPLNAHRKELVSVQAALEREKELSREVMRGEHDDDDDALGDL